VQIQGIRTILETTEKENLNMTIESFTFGKLPFDTGRPKTQQ